MTRRRDLKQRLKLQLRNLGWDVHRYSPTDYPMTQLLSSLNHVGAEVVFDIGANTGEFAEELRDTGFGGEIISFEPLSAAHRELVKSAQGDPKWIIHPRCAVGDFDGEIEINVAGNSVSSSVLPMLDLHSDVAKDSAYVGVEKAPISRLDDLSHGYLSDRENCRYVVKIDTQGFEWQVLDGGENTIGKASGVICELSLAPLYEGQHLYREIIDRLESMGFVLWALLKGFTDHQTGRSMQVDGVFLRT